MKKGFVCGAWDLLHAGHIMLLKDCKDRCDVLTVGLHVDPSKERPEKNKPVQSIFERIVQLKGCKFVDHIAIYETEKELELILRDGEFDYRFLGTDYKDGCSGNDGNKKITGEEIVPIVFIQRNHNYSSTELRQRICQK